MLAKSNTPLYIGLLLAFVLGLFVARGFYMPKTVPQEEATVLLEKIQAVSKLTTVEGQFSEIYNYSEYQGYFTLFWDKKALVRVRATVSAGYDLNNLKIETVAETRTVRISQMPDVQILSIDHSLDYYDLSNGLFTSFSSEDLTRINQRAKDMIRDQAQKSNLLQAAREQGAKTLDIIKFMVESAGWKLEIVSPNPTQLG